MEDELKQTLSDFVGRELHETAWIADLPINPGIGINSLLLAFEQNGSRIIHYSEERAASFRIPWHGKLFEATLSYEELKNGWGNHPPASPKSLYDSICEVYDRAGKSISSCNEINQWGLFRGDISKTVRKSMEDNLQPYFMKHHEHMLLPFSFKIPRLEDPALFDRAIARYPLHIHDRAIRWNIGSANDYLVGPCAENIAEHGEEDFDEDYHPSENSMLDYFFGIYLHELAKQKKYPMYYPEDKRRKDRIRTLTVRGAEGLENGYRVWQKMKGTNR